MEIRPGVGVGCFLFGLTEADLLRALGSPDKRYWTDSDAVRLQYFGPKLEFSIEPHNDGRVGWIEVHSAEATLFGQPVVGESVASVLAFVSEALDEKAEHDDYGSFESYFYRRNWVELQVEFGVVVALNIGVLYNDADEPLWPAGQAEATAERLFE